MGCGLPSCLSRKSSRVRPETGWPLASRTMAETATMVDSTLRVGVSAEMGVGCDGAGAGVALGFARG